MQRLYSMFPSGVPGAALALLRLSVAGSLLADGHAPPLAPWWLSLGLAVLLAGGTLTPLAALATALVFAAAFSRLPTETVTVWLALQAVALALLGPGAYSVDARRFGRRLVVTSNAGQE